MGDDCVNMATSGFEDTMRKPRHAAIGTPLVENLYRITTKSYNRSIGISHGAWVAICTAASGLVAGGCNWSQASPGQDSSREGGDKDC